MSEQNAVLGFVRDPKFEKANSALEFLLVLPEMDEMATERNSIVSNAQGDLVNRASHMFLRCFEFMCDTAPNPHREDRARKAKAPRLRSRPKRDIYRGSAVPEQ